MSRTSITAWHTLKWSLTPLKGHKTPSRPPINLLRALRPPNPPVRLYKSTPSHREYPKEGVFQPNSPSRYSNQPSSQNLEPNRYFPHQPHDQAPSPQTVPPQQYQGYQQYNQPPPPGSEGDLTNRRSTLRFIVRTLKWTTTILVPVAAGYLVSIERALELIPLPFDPGSPEDLEQLELLSAELDDLALAQQLRSEWRLDPSTSHEEPLWREWAAYKSVAGRAGSQNRLTTGPLRGSQGLAAQRVFWNESEGLCVVFVNFGEGCCGWPGVVHGGAIATVVDESLGRCAMWSLGDAQKVEQGEEGPGRKHPMVTASLEMSYEDKCVPGQWYVVVSELDRFHGHESNDRKRYVAGAMVCANEEGPTKEQILGDEVAPSTGQDEDEEESQEGAHVHVSARGLFVVPKGGGLRPIEGEF